MASIAEKMLPKIKIVAGLNFESSHVFVDGVELKGVTRIQFCGDVDQKVVNKIQLEMQPCEIEIEGFAISPQLEIIEHAPKAKPPEPDA